MSKLNEYIREFMSGTNYVVIKEEDANEVLEPLETFIKEANCDYSISENVAGDVLVIITKVNEVE